MGAGGSRRRRPTRPCLSIVDDPRSLDIRLSRRAEHSSRATGRHTPVTARLSTARFRARRCRRSVRRRRPARVSGPSMPIAPGGVGAELRRSWPGRSPQRSAAVSLGLGRRPGDRGSPWSSAGPGDRRSWSARSAPDSRRPPPARLGDGRARRRAARASGGGGPATIARRSTRRRPTVSSIPARSRPTPR